MKKTNNIVYNKEVSVLVKCACGLSAFASDWRVFRCVCGKGYRINIDVYEYDVDESDEKFPDMLYEERMK